MAGLGDRCGLRRGGGWGCEPSTQTLKTDRNEKKKNKIKRPKTSQYKIDVMRSYQLEIDVYICWARKQQLYLYCFYITLAAVSLSVCLSVSNKTNALCLNKPDTHLHNLRHTLQLRPRSNAQEITRKPTVEVDTSRCATRRISPRHKHPARRHLQQPGPQNWSAVLTGLSYGR